MDAPHHRDAPPAIDTGAIETFVTMAFDGLEGFVPIRVLGETGTPPKSPRSWYPSIALAASEIGVRAPQAIKEGCGLYAVPGTVAKTGRAMASDIVETRVVVVDLDAGDIEAKRDHLVKHLGVPSLEVASGGITGDGVPKLHLYWRLASPARGADLERVRALREAIALKAGGDASFKSLHQPIRVPGTIHGKHGKPAAVRILEQSAVEHDLATLVRLVRDMPALPGLAPVIDTGPASGKGYAVRDLATRPVRAGSQDGISRFEALSSVIGHWLRNARLGRCPLDEAWAAVREHNIALIRPPWDEEHLRREFEALLRRDRAAHPERRPQDAISADTTVPPELSEDALATAFVGRHGADWRHVRIWGAWYRWAGTHWQNDETGLVRELIRHVCRGAASGCAIPRQAERVASAKTVASVERIASADPRVAARGADWDTWPMLLNTPAGTLDLASGEVMPHDPGHLLTQMTAASPGSGCPRWIAFLEEITAGDCDLQGYLARLAGYCLTGDTSEQMLAFLHGHGANGKSVFLRVIAAVMGDYAATATLETFVDSRGARHLTELAGLRAARLVLVPETEAGASWAEGRIKMVTGGEKIRANFMRRDHFEFLPQFKLLVAGNHRPQLGSVGEAMRRRLHLVPFAVTIPPDHRDPGLFVKLMEERDGILGWMLDGCAEWQRIGLVPPASVADAAGDYFETEDIIGQWITEECVLGDEHRATARALFASWEAWATAAGEPCGTQKKLGEALRSRGFVPCRVNHSRGWIGIAPRSGTPRGATA